MTQRYILLITCAYIYFVMTGEEAGTDGNSDNGGDAGTDGDSEIEGTGKERKIILKCKTIRNVF